jgi:hypothetical protein
MAMREYFQCRFRQCRLWLLAFGVVQLLGLWQCYGAWFARGVLAHAG